jgi:hypothetical protein
MVILYSATSALIRFYAAGERLSLLWSVTGLQTNKMWMALWTLKT